MKKLIIIVMFTIILMPVNTKALTIGTKIIGNEKIKAGNTVMYTVILDHPLNEYSAEISYDREVLNLVDVEEININTTEKKFAVERSNPILVNIKSDEPADIVYTLTFDVKNYTTLDSTEITLKTTKANYQKESLTFTEAFIKPSIIKQDTLFQEEGQNAKDNYLSKTMASIKEVLNEYGNPITYCSLGLNLILLISLIASIMRKKVDYDF